jgi:hypothetical protein
MGTLDTLYFPDTILAAACQSPLFFLFGTVHYLQPVETDAPQDGKQSDTFMDHAFCQAHTPAPLGPDRDRFLRLVADIRLRKDDYAAQLSSLAIASLSAARNGEENSQTAILSTLTGGVPDQESQKLAARRAELWQARLVLAMAEILDREEEEITLALNLLDKSKADLFNRLLGKEEGFEEDAAFTDLALLQERVNLPRPEMMNTRLKAWLSLYRAGAPSGLVWTTSRREAADIIFEMHEKKTGRAAILLWEVELPAASDFEPTADEILRFRMAAEPLTTRIAETFNGLVLEEPPEDVPAGLLQEKEAWNQEWASLLETHFPKERSGRTPCRFYLLPGISLPELAGFRAPETAVRNGILGTIG